MKALNLIKRFTPIYMLVKILLDSRYLYHFIQGFFTTNVVRAKLRPLEIFFFKSRRVAAQALLKSTDEIPTLYDGMILNPILVPRDLATSIRKELQPMLCFDPENVNLGKFLIDSCPGGVQRAYYSASEVGKINSVFKIANNESLIKIASNYFGAVPSIDYINAWWSFPSEALALTQSYHRDIDTLHSLKFFLYLTDVDQDSGPHIFIKNSLSDPFFSSKKDAMYSDKEIESQYGSEQKCEIVGDAGTNFIADTFNYHKGLLPLSKPRLLLSIIYTIQQTPFGPKKPYINSHDVPFIKHNDEKIFKKINKNLIKW